MRPQSRVCAPSEQHVCALRAACAPSEQHGRGNVFSRPPGAKAAAGSVRLVCLLGGGLVGLRAAVELALDFIDIFFFSIMLIVYLQIAPCSVGWRTSATPATSTNSTPTSAFVSDRPTRAARNRKAACAIIYFVKTTAYFYIFSFWAGVGTVRQHGGFR